jgi:hypothetical protein
LERDRQAVLVPASVERDQALVVRVRAWAARVRELAARVRGQAAGHLRVICRAFWECRRLARCRQAAGLELAQVRLASACDRA